MYGCELDKIAYARLKQKWQTKKWGKVPTTLENKDFFMWMPPGTDAAAALDKSRYFSANKAYFDLIIGNPPFGGSIQAALQDPLDGILGIRENRKIKKETYAFFIVKSMDLLKPGGQLVFICSDTLLTISTMAGLRSWLQKNFTVNISPMRGEFQDAAQQMILIRIKKCLQPQRRVTVFGAALSLENVNLTPNHSWSINNELIPYFTGCSLGDKMVATSGMTIGKNELFVRKIQKEHIEETYSFRLEQEHITLEKTLARARLGKISEQRHSCIMNMIARGETETVVKWTPLARPRKIKLPHVDYAYYNKAISKIVYCQPEWAVFWRNQGEYVYTFKKNGNWYLHGVGGKKYFTREGLTWPLIASRLCIRYLPPGYILDSGAPCAFLRPGVPQQELFFILGWTLTRLCNRLLKEILNHTRNNQSKDFERLPYPVWVSAACKKLAIKSVKNLIKQAQSGKAFTFNSPEIQALEDFYTPHNLLEHRKESRLQLELL